MVSWADRAIMDEPSEPRLEPKKTVECGMCRRKVPIDDTRVISGRKLCFGCLASWYDEDEKEE